MTAWRTRSTYAFYLEDETMPPAIQIYSQINHHVKHTLASWAARQGAGGGRVSGSRYSPGRSAASLYEG